MGVDLRGLDVINRLNHHGWIKNKSILTLGRQSINVPLRVGQAFPKWLDEVLIFLGSKLVDSMDVSPYENASIVFDLQTEPPDHLLNKYDVLLDFGTTEHIFDLRSTFRNIWNFLKPNGLYVSIVPRTGWADHGLYQFSPEFFWTLSDTLPFTLEIYTTLVDTLHADFFLYHSYGQDPAKLSEIFSQNRTYNVCFARKYGSNATNGVVSTCPRYRDNYHKTEFTAGLPVASVSQLSTSEFITKPPPPAHDRVAIFHIATGPYKIFTERFVSSAIDGFEPRKDKIFYLITDDPGQVTDLHQRLRCPIRHLKVAHEEWPNPTLKRFEYICQLEAQLRDDGVTHAFFVNANAVFISASPIDELRREKKMLGFVRHPGFSKYPALATFEDQDKSLAYIPGLDPASEPYIQGFFYGGEINAFLGMTFELRDRVRVDLSHGIVARWHDESHLNWARISRWRNDSIVFDSGYAYPEGWSIDSPIRILSLDKSKRIDLSFKQLASNS